MTRYLSTNHPNVNLAFFTFLLAFIVILLGAYTRLTDAGLSCPDWPHCYGYLTAPHTSAQIQDALQKYPLAPVNVKKAWTEMTHRYVAGTEGILILILAFSILFNTKLRSVTSKVIALSLIALLCFQVILGMLTVTEKLKPVIVLGHLLTGISLLSLLWFTYLDGMFKRRTTSYHPPFIQFFNNRPAQNKIILLTWIGIIIVAMQIALGGWVSSHYAGLACVDFPFCRGQLFPPLQWQHLNDDLITIHMLHRIGALITASYLVAFSLYLIITSLLPGRALLLLLFIGAQITLGTLNIIWLRPLWIAIAHQSIAILILLTLITFLVKASYRVRNRHGI